MDLSSKRAERLSLVALVLHVAFFIMLGLMAGWARSSAILVESWHFLGGSIIWLVLLVQFRQRRLVQQENIDARQYQLGKQQGHDSSVFEGAGVESGLLLSQRRLGWIEKWLVAIFAVVAAGYLIVIGGMQYRSIAPIELAGHDVKLISAASLAGLAVLNFLFSFYAIGLSRHDLWRPIRAGGSYMLSNAIACGALALVLILADFDYARPAHVLAYVLAIVMVAIGAEIILNLLLDLFRPRIKGQYRLAPYESRLLGLFSESGGLLRTAAHAIDYQFGFKVSDTWFYRLLQRAVLPLILLQVVILYLMTSIAVVQPGSLGVLERFGVPMNLDRPYKSGLHLKMPWPIDAVREFPVERAQLIEIGFQRHDDSEVDMPVLWTQIHWKQEFPFMVAVPKMSDRLPAELPSEASGEQPDLETAAVSAENTATGNDCDLLVVAMVVHYRIGDIAKYGYGEAYGYQDPRELLECICSQIMLEHAAHCDIQTLMGPGRQGTAKYLKEAIQQEVYDIELGVDIVFVGMESIHPPVDVAESFENVVAAIQQKQAVVLNSHGTASEIMEFARGQSEVLAASAQAYGFGRPAIVKATANRFAKQLQAYEKGGKAYLEREYLNMLDETLGGLRKYVWASDNVDSWVYQFDLKEKLQPDLFEDIGLPKAEQEIHP